MQHDLAEVVRHFAIEGEFLRAEPYGTGHINDTYASHWRTAGGAVRYIQQRINHKIFTNPPALMENIDRVIRHIRGKRQGVPGADPQRECLTVVPARDGKLYYCDGDGNYWRTYVFIEGARTFDVCAGPPQAFASALAFGHFQALLADLPGGPLHETIPFFHHTPRRMAALEQAVTKDIANRSASARAEIEFALARKPMTAVVTEGLEQGTIPNRVTHNDTKLNNVMLDDRTGTGVCVIDLDTVMNGSVLYDFGDMVRTHTRASAEDERDLDKVTLQMDAFEALTRGYMRSAGSFLVPAEIDRLAFSGRLITFTIGIRFLTDYLAGDVYFKTHRPGHNLDRARVQFKMVAEMEALEDRMNAVVRQCAGR
jgi:hypothetical protein